MVSYQGTFEFFDNRFLAPSEVLPTLPPKIITYPKDSIMYYLEQYHPKFAFIAKKAKMDWYLASESLRSTLFLPTDESISESILLNLDINTSRRIIKYHLMSGLFPSYVLKTSPYQELFTTIKGSSITWIMYSDSEIYLNNQIPILSMDHYYNNGIIHIIQEMMIYS